MNISERIQRAEQTPGDPRDLAKGIVATLSKAEAKQLLEDYIAEQRATWEKVTVDQHKRRAEYLIKQAATVYEDAARHLYAVRAIEDAGARTLGELA